MDFARCVALLFFLLTAAFSWVAPAAVQAQTQSYYSASNRLVQTLDNYNGTD